MRLAHFIDIRVFAKEWDDEEKITEALTRLLPFSPIEEKIGIRKKTAFGFEDKKIKIISISLEKEKHTSKFINIFFSRFSKEQKELLLEQAESRLDSNLHFFIRLEKDRLLENEFWITDGGNCFHFNIAVAAYPHKRETALGIIRKILA